MQKIAIIPFFVNFFKKIILRVFSVVFFRKITTIKKSNFCLCCTILYSGFWKFLAKWAI